MISENQGGDMGEMGNDFKMVLRPSQLDLQLT